MNRYSLLFLVGIVSFSALGSHLKLHCTGLDWEGRYYDVAVEERFDQLGVSRIDLVFKQAVPGPVPEGGGEINYEPKVAFVQPIQGLVKDQDDIVFARAVNHLGNQTLHEVEVQIHGKGAIGKVVQATLTYTKGKAMFPPIPVSCFLSPPMMGK